MLRPHEEVGGQVLSTPYSTNRLFSEFFKEFSRVVLGVRETICTLFGDHLGGVLVGI